MGKCLICRRFQNLINEKFCKDCLDLIKGED
jgi:hypothetical protein